MLRSAASSILSSARTAIRVQAIRASSGGSSLQYTRNEADGKTIIPSNQGVEGPSPSVAPEQWTDKDYPGYEGQFIPGKAWSDGVDRLVFDSKKVPPRYQHNPTIIESPAKESDDEMDARYINYFNRPDIDGWELRRGLQLLHNEDLVPEPKVTIAAFQAMRRVNEFGLAVRWLECIKYKCGSDVKKIWPWMMQELGPTMKELGIPTLEEMGYDKPELWQEDVMDM